MACRQGVAARGTRAGGGCGILCHAPQRARENAGAGGIWGCKGGAGRCGWDAWVHGSPTPRMQVCRTRLWAREGAGGPGRWALRTSAAAGGELSTTDGRSPYLGGRSEAGRYMPNEQTPPKVRAPGRISSRQSLRPVQTRSTVRRKGGSVLQNCRKPSVQLVHGASMCIPQPLPGPRYPQKIPCNPPCTQ